VLVMGLAQGGEVAGVGPAAVFPVDQVVNLQASVAPQPGMTQHRSRRR
jgi:hypothetical protein